MKYIAVFDVPDETTPIDDTAELVCCGKVSEVYAKVKPLPKNLKAVILGEEGDTE